MNRYLLTIATLISSILVLDARDCGPTLQTVKVNDLGITRHNDKLEVTFTLDFTDIELGNNQQVIYTPVITSEDGTHSVALEKIVLNGRNASITEQRLPGRRVSGAVETIRRHNGTSQNVNYRFNTPYKDWMSTSTLSLSEDLCGCGDLQSQDRIELSRFCDQRVQKIAAYVEPEIEQPKIRHEKGSASIDFAVNSLSISPDYRNNRTEINKIVSTIDVVKNDNNVEITDINIHGYASPEGDYDHNTYLAEHRTQSLMDYVKGLYDIPGAIFTMQSTPEDWEGLREYVSGSHLSHRNEILSIIDDPTLPPDAKDWRIKLRYTDEYNELLQTVFPRLRRSDYTISYIVRPFTAEESLEVLKVNPKQVSLYEMFWAAQSLGVDSEGYEEIIDLAVRTYPEEPVANYNASIVSVNRGDYSQALKYLEKVPESAKTINVRGVISMNLGAYEEAKAYFRRAVATGIPEAGRNLELLEGLMTGSGQQ